MITDEIKIVLADIHSLCQENDIEYCVTGTLALELLGLTMSTPPGDIDILVKESDFKKFSLADYFSGEETSADYNTQCYTFKARNGCKVNILMRAEPILYHLGLLYPFSSSMQVIPVQPLTYALQAKFKLGRYKDYEYFARIIKLLSNVIK